MEEFIKKLNRHESLSQDEIASIMHEIMSGEADHSDVGDFLLALNDKGPNIDEITGAADILRKFYVPVKTKHKVILDTCGTGGDKKNTFNISTVTALVVAAAGVAVAKHGNRSVSSKCGSADILEALGVNIDLPPDKLGACLDQVGIAFLFAQKLHPAMKNVAPVRKALGVKTIFNILGPLSNPASATHQVVGVYSRDLIEPMAHVLMNLGVKKALVVHGSDGLDEVTTTGITYVCEFNGKEILSYDVDASELNIPLAQEKDLKGGDIETNVAIVESILNQKKGPKRDIVILNAAYALYAAERVKTLSDGVALAAETLDTGAAWSKLEELKVFTNK